MQLLSEESLSFSRDKDILTIKLNTNIEDPTIAFSDGGEEWITFIKRAEFGEKYLCNSKLQPMKPIKSFF